MIAALTNHLWQSTLFVLAAALLATALRQNGAHIRHRIWLIASMKFLVPLSILMSLGGALPQLTPAATTTPSSVPGLSIAVDRFTQPFAGDGFFSSAVASTQSGTSPSLPLIIGAWACGFIAVVLMRVRGWRRVRTALRVSTHVPIDAPVPVRSSPGLLEPGVVGLWRPVLLVPEGIEHQLTPQQLQTVLLHELCHVRRRDNLTSAIHMIVEAVFWFHPLVWWVGARLVDERERACDEHVLRECGEPRVYAEGILNVCKLYVESPVACVSGVGGADLRRRVAAILVNHVGLQLSLARKVTLAIVAVLAIGLPVAVGMLTAPASIFAAQSAASAFAQATADQTADKPKFDVVSVKPCEANAPGQQRGGGGTPITSPGRLHLQCYPIISLIKEAYLYFADGRAHGLSSVINVPIEGGPEWINSDRFAIEAKIGQTVAAALMRGPMLQAILEDRFKLKVRRVTREMPVYELIAGKSGAKVAPYTGTDCIIRDDALWPPATPPEGQRFCGDRSRAEDDLFVREGVMKLDELVSLWAFDLPVVNKTGITAPVRYRFAYPKDSIQISQAPSGSFLTALRNEMGLDLRVSKGPRDFLVIDHVERPTPNPPSPTAPSSRGFGAASPAPEAIR